MKVIMLLLFIKWVLLFKCAIGYEDDVIMYPDDDHQHHHHPHEPTFQHSAEFHRNHPNLPYPDHSPDFHHNHHHHHHYHKPVEKVAISNLSSVPLDIILKYNNFNDVNDILHNLVEGNIEESNEPMILANRFGDERSAAIIPKAANCMPELQTVKIAPTDDPSVFYIPSCTRIERCAGCCSHSLLACQPVETETVSFQLFKTQYQGGPKMKFVGKEIVTVERHIKCNCTCKVQAKDCNQFQEHRAKECGCVCTNRDEEKKCDKNSMKLWNPELCSCQCRNIFQCSTGYSFDMLKCKCMPSQMRRRYAEFSVGETIPSKPQPLPVLPMQGEEDDRN